MPINILDPDVINLLKENNLYNLIISVYEKAPINKNNNPENNNMDNKIHFDGIFYINKSKKNNSIFLKFSEENKPKPYWLQTYI